MASKKIEIEFDYMDIQELETLAGECQNLQNNAHFQSKETVIETLNNILKYYVGSARDSINSIAAECRKQLKALTAPPPKPKKAPVGKPKTTGTAPKTKSKTTKK